MANQLDERFASILSAPDIQSALSRAGESERGSLETQREFARAVLGLRSNSRHFSSRRATRDIFVVAWQAAR